MQNQFVRTAMVIGEEGVGILARSSVAVFGIGGVGSFAAEALARAGVGQLTFVDDDVVAASNLNRQLIALHSTLGQSKAELMAARARDINPAAEVEAVRMFYGRDTVDDMPLGEFDYVVDAVDTVTAKLLLVESCQRLGVPIISSMGTGNKLDPTRLELADIYDTSICPLARVMRRELRARGVEALKVLYSQEEPLPPRPLMAEEDGGGHQKRQTPGSVSFVPSAAGLIIAGEVVRDLLHF